MKVYIRSSMEVDDAILEEFARRVYKELGYRPMRYARQVAQNCCNELCDLFGDEDINTLDDAIEYMRKLDDVDISELLDKLADEGIMI